MKWVYPGFSGDHGKRGPSKEAAKTPITTIARAARQPHLRIHRFQRRVRSIDVGVQNIDELGDDFIAAKRAFELAIDVDGRHRFLESARKRDPQIRFFRFAWTVYDAAHHRDLHLLDARVLRLPYGHLFAQIRLNLVGHVLEKSAGGASAAGARGDLRRETAQLE